MKKVIAILTIAIVLVGALVAATGDQLTLTCTVAEHKPAFQIFGGETSSAAAATQGTSAGASVGTTKDISLTDIVIYCRIKQYSVTNGYNETKCKFKGVANITITASDLIAEVDGTNYSQSASAAVPENGAHVVSGVSATTYSASGNAVSISFTYTGKKVNDSDVYADCTFTWAEKDDLPPATYNATITMTYTGV